jgi:hypothetical protein
MEPQLLLPEGDQVLLADCSPRREHRDTDAIHSREP